MLVMDINMPVHQGQDKKGSFFQYGSQKKYYFQTPIGAERAKNKAHQQAIAIKVSEKLK